MKEKYYTVKEVAEYLHLCPGTIYNKIYLGDDFPIHIKPFRGILFPIDEFHRWVEEKSKR